MSSFFQARFKSIANPSPDDEKAPVYPTPIGEVQEGVTPSWPPEAFFLFLSLFLSPPHSHANTCAMTLASPMVRLTLERSLGWWALCSRVDQTTAG